MLGSHGTMLDFLGRGDMNPMVLKNIVCPGSEHFRAGEIFLPNLFSLVRVVELQMGHE